MLAVNFNIFLLVKCEIFRRRHYKECGSLVTRKKEMEDAFAKIKPEDLSGFWKGIKSKKTRRWKMKKYQGSISTNVVGSECHFEFEVKDDATEEEIDEAARDAAFDWVDWFYNEVNENDK